MRELLGVLVMGATLLGSVACGPKAITQDEAGEQGSSSETSTTTTTTTTSPAETGTETSTMGPSTTVTDTDDTSDDQTSRSGVFYGGADVDIGALSECSTWAQDCPEGEKCVPYGSTGGHWDENKCVFVTGEGQPGDPCTYEGTAEASDDCGPESVCWHAFDDGEMGTCRAHCTGDAADPVCAPGTACLMAFDGAVTLCLETCSPLMQDCDEDFACYWAGAPFGESAEFLCTNVFGEGVATNEACGFHNDCDPGHACVNGEVFPDCQGSACCSAFCDVQDPEACPDPELSCVPFFDAPAPLGWEDVGVCILPDA